MNSAISITMKRIFLSILSCVLVAGFVSCNKEMEGRPSQLLGEKSANVYFQVGLETKAGSEPSDASLGLVQVVLFDAGSGTFEASGSMNFNGSSTGSVELTGVRLDRPYVCRVVANVLNGSGSDVMFTSASSVSEIDDYVVSLPAYVQDRIPMWGTTENATVTFTSTNKTANVKLIRAASRIKVAKVTADFPDHIKSKSAAVTAIYVYKAPGKYTLGLAAPATNTYYHQTAYSASDASALGSFAPYVGELMTSGNSISNNGSYDSARWFVVCPHASFAPSVPTDATFLTIEVTIDGTPYYYGVPLTDIASNPDGLRPNYQYILSNVKLTDYGNVVPPGIIDKDAISVNISVEEWHDGFNKEVTF